MVTGRRLLSYQSAVRYAIQTGALPTLQVGGNHALRFKQFCTLFHVVPVYVREQRRTSPLRVLVTDQIHLHTEMHLTGHVTGYDQYNWFIHPKILHQAACKQLLEQLFVSKKQQKSKTTPWKMPFLELSGFLYELSGTHFLPPCRY